MGEAKHTPGPWTIDVGVHSDRSSWWRIDGINGPIAGEGICSAGLADARLIAAAPRMLEALEEAIGMLDPSRWEGTPGYEMIRAAIWEATDHPSGPAEWLRPPVKATGQE